MKLITIQNEAVLDILKNNEIYFAPKTKIENLIAPYEYIKQNYNWFMINASPVFACIVGKPAEFDGAAINDSVILELDVPDDLVKQQIYYDWTDLIYFTEWPNDFYCEYGEDANFDEYVKRVLSGEDISKRPNAAIQATIPYIDSKWLIGVYDLRAEFIKKYFSSAGNNILDESSYKNASRVQYLQNKHKLNEKLFN